MGDLIIKNISNASRDFLESLNTELNNLNPKIVRMIKNRNLKIIVANKLSDVLNEKENRILIDYNVENKDLTTRGLCSDTVGAIAIFSDVTGIKIIGAILYHEIGHLFDRYNSWEVPSYSNSKDFIEAYQKDISKNWDKIVKDKRFRLKHYIQNSTPDNISFNATCETFAHCFAYAHNKFDDELIVAEYFDNALECTKKFLVNL